MILSLAADSGKRGLPCGPTNSAKSTSRERGRYPSDVTDEEWAIIEPMIPPARTGGRKRETDMREVFNAIRYINRTGCQWRQLPKDFPPHTTVYNYFRNCPGFR